LAARFQKTAGYAHGERRLNTFSIPETSGGAVVNRFCGSSMDAVHQISARIETVTFKWGLQWGEDMFSVRWAIQS